MKNLTWQNPEQLFVAQELINKVKSKCCGIKGYVKRGYSLWVFEIFVSSLFLVSVTTKKLSCISITYKEITGFEEEDHDDCLRRLFLVSHNSFVVFVV